MCLTLASSFKKPDGACVWGREGAKHPFSVHGLCALSWNKAGVWQHPRSCSQPLAGWHCADPLPPRFLSLSLNDESFERASVSPLPVTQPAR